MRVNIGDSSSRQCREMLAVFLLVWYTQYEGSEQKMRVEANGIRTRDLPPITCYGHKRVR